jgi:hypothetical protein
MAMNTSAWSQWFATTPPFNARLKRTKLYPKQRKITETAGKQHVREALDHSEFSQGDRKYHFLKLFRGSLPNNRVQELAYRMLYALQFIHDAQVIHGGPTFPPLSDPPLALGLQA